LKGRTSITTNALEGLKVVEIIERINEQRDKQPEIKNNKTRKEVSEKIKTQ
jgi:hypothetical protein